MEKIQEIRIKYLAIKGELNERSRRLWAATEAISIGHKGIKIVHKATGLAESTIQIGKKEIINKETIEQDRIRRTGAGRCSLEKKDKEIVDKILKIADIDSIGDPESPLRWTTKSLRNISEALKEKGYKISHTKIGNILKKSGFSLQATRKRNEGKSHVDRDKQFKYINSKTKEFQDELQPVISVDAKKKELVGNFSNVGKEYHKKGNPLEVNAYDFLSFADGKATPYGVYEITTNKAWVSVGISKDTAQFAVSSIRNWWYEMGEKMYPDSKKILIHADGGGRNGSRNKLWKVELQNFATETGLEISVCHFPPGTSKWNKIEHRLFSQISKNWRGRPLETFSIIVNLIASTKTTTGLKVKTAIDTNIYKTGIKITNKELNNINLIKHEFHGEDWNYTIKPKNRTPMAGD
ncbi:MAG: ISAzo13 family transposase [Bacteroidetes bacterium]|mgnify:CR=1 FL=1|jgi:transposase|nr:ISAzo13 family transposase [Bacteroidota bacterium]MBT6684883.1 ISAzo13 family transposase [Bacteroidota bacterium]MBT7143734.1 ISAzo13 family transposase [Bacteroidota bacterium]MBT7492084.1 ISAzo13 family transposase [Bacteroidota bacterium]